MRGGRWGRAAVIITLGNLFHTVGDGLLERCGPGVKPVHVCGRGHGPPRGGGKATGEKAAVGCGKLRAASHGSKSSCPSAMSTRSADGTGPAARRPQGVKAGPVCRPGAHGRQSNEWKQMSARSERSACARSPCPPALRCGRFPGHSFSTKSNWPTTTVPDGFTTVVILSTSPMSRT